MHIRDIWFRRPPWFILPGPDGQPLLRVRLVANSQGHVHGVVMRCHWAQGGESLRRLWLCYGKGENVSLKVLNIYTSSTAQGGGGSFKNRKPIGEIGCCESGMAERIHWWTERCLRSPLFLSLSLTIYLPIYLLCIYLSIDLSIYLPIYLSFYLSTYLSIYLSLSLSFICLSV